MKRISIVLTALMFTGFMFAQEGKAPLSIGEKQLNFGLGLSNNGFPVYGGIDFAVHNDVTVGGNLAFNLDGFDYMTITARGDYHWNRLMGIPSNWDFYTGLNLGGDIGFNENGSGFHLNVHLGGRWYWSEKWALNLEFGGGTGFGSSIGVSMKF